MASIDRRRIDPQKEADGVWVTWFEDVEINVARSRHPDFKNAMERIHRNFRRKKPNAPITEAFKDDDEARKQLAPHIANHLVLGWKNIQDVDDKGQEVDFPFTFANAMKLLKDKDLDFFEFVLGVANDEEVYRKEDVSEDAKNSEPLSDGT